MKKLEKLAPFFLDMKELRAVSGGQEKKKKGNKGKVTSNKTDTQKNDDFKNKPDSVIDIRKL
jgi:hypothetical protein